MPTPAYWQFLDHQRKLLLYAELGRSLYDVFKWFGVPIFQDASLSLDELKEVAEEYQEYKKLKAKEEKRG